MTVHQWAYVRDLRARADADRIEVRRLPEHPWEPLADPALFDADHVAWRWAEQATPTIRLLRIIQRGAVREHLPEPVADLCPDDVIDIFVSDYLAELGEVVAKRIIALNVRQALALAPEASDNLKGRA